MFIMSYDHKEIEAKWQKRWAEAEVFKAEDDVSKEKSYLLVEFPYPSGAGLHVGHPRPYTAVDALARKSRMEGKNVLFPMGWDAFGLPTENYAIKTGRKPQEVTEENIATFKRQLQSLGFSFDWSREVSTTDPEYYKWTQWMFLKFFEAGLTYKAKAEINWCPKDKIGLANEEVVGGVCERCGTAVEKREKEQWMIAITKYADRLLSDLDTVDCLPKIKKQQADWIGRSEGAEVRFALDFKKNPADNDRRGPKGEKAAIPVFTTRPDTLFGATYLVLAPEHLWVQLATDNDHDVLENKDEVIAYVQSVKNRTDIERTAEGKEKTGVEIKGVKAINPATGEEIPMFVADYVLPQYGTGAIMAVPAHDERDQAFAQKFSLPITTVVEPVTGEVRENEEFRRSIVAVVRNPKTNEFLSINWGKELGGNLFVGGGLDEGEDPVECAKREIAEETGYKNVRLVSQSETIHHHYFAHSKNKARIIDAIGLYFELEDEERGEQALEENEKNKFTVEWLSATDADRLVTETLHQYVFDKLVKGVCYTGEGMATNSGFLDGLTTAEAKEKAIAWLEEQEIGNKKITYKLRDWVFSRQRYWGEPIPLIDCPEHGWVAVPEDQLPVTLPDVEKYQPTDTGESPLANVASWVNTTCPQCGSPAKRETDTMPNWAGSSWYFLRYVDPKNNQAFAAKDKLDYWTPVDFYNGGMEHTTLHLLYSRFWHKFMFDQGLVPTAEPYLRRYSHGLIMAEDGTKMSKSKGNVVNPDEIVREYGADALRTYLLFMGPFEEPVPWSTNGLLGVSRFLEKVIRLAENVVEQESIGVTKALHKTIAKVSEDINAMRFNTAVAEFMKFVNLVGDEKGITKDSLTTFLKLLVPFAPHISNELAAQLGHEGFLEQEAWPKADNAMLVDDEVTIVVQVNGKVRANLIVPAKIEKDELLTLAKQDPNVAKYLESGVKKEVVVPGKLVNFVV